MNAGCEWVGHLHFEDGVVAWGNRLRIGDWSKKVNVAEVGTVITRAAKEAAVVVDRRMCAYIEPEFPQGNSSDLENPVTALGCMNLTQRGTGVKECRDFVVMQVIFVQVTVVVHSSLPLLPYPRLPRSGRE